MRSTSRKTVWIFLSLTFACLILLLLTLSYYHLEQGIRILLAREQVRIFSSMVEDARKNDVHNAIGCLEYTQWYYTSGSKQVAGSPLDEIVETSRKLAIEDIISILRQKSDKDFGSDPKLWIENRKIFEPKNQNIKKDASDQKPCPPKAKNQEETA